MCSSPAASVKGLSPPTRGNLELRRDVVREVGSIPAHAGEPLNRIAILGVLRVYPRPRGGTAAVSEFSAVSSGLSPPTRGNHAGAGR